jgi:phosphatidylglycerol lysyltransferase
MVRTSKDAPGGIVDFILVEMFNHFKFKGYNYANIGFAPLSGINDPHNFPEQSMRFMYEKFKSFSHYKGLRLYKEKFDPKWYNKYLIYQHDYDLFQIPGVLRNVMRP